MCAIRRAHARRTRACVFFCVCVRRVSRGGDVDARGMGVTVCVRVDDRAACGLSSASRVEARRRDGGGGVSRARARVSSSSVESQKKAFFCVRRARA